MSSRHGVPPVTARPLSPTATALFSTSTRTPMRPCGSGKESEPGPVACPHQSKALVSFEDIELGDHGVEAGGTVLTAQTAERKNSLFSYSGCCSGPDGAVVSALCASFAASLATFLLTPFCLSPLFFLPLHFLLALFERDAHGSPQSSGSTPSSLRVVGLPARFARLAGGLAVILVRESAVAATTAGASDAAIIARRALALGSRFVDLKVVGLILFRRDRQWPSLPRRHWAFSTKAKPRARPVSRSVTT